MRQKKLDELEDLGRNDKLIQALKNDLLNTYSPSEPEGE